MTQGNDSVSAICLRFCSFVGQHVRGTGIPRLTAHSVLRPLVDQTFQTVRIGQGEAEEALQLATMSRNEEHVPVTCRDEDALCRRFGSGATEKIEELSSAIEGAAQGAVPRAQPRAGPQGQGGHQNATASETADETQLVGGGVTENERRGQLSVEPFEERPLRSIGHA